MEDPFKKAANGADAGFDFDAEFDAGKKTETESEKEEREKKEKEKAERKESIEKLVEFYRKIVSTDTASELFGIDDYRVEPEKKIKDLKQLRAKLLSQFSENNFNSNRTANPFPQEITRIASKTHLLINSFFEEAKELLDGRIIDGKKEKNRKDNQASFASSIDLDIANALAAEERLNGDDQEEKQKKEETERAEREREQAEKEQEEKEREERERAEREKAEAEKNNNNGSADNSHEGESGNQENGNEAEKERLILGLSEKTFGAFKNYGSRAWDSYIADLGGKNGQPGYLDKFTTAEKKANFLASLVEVIVQEKVAEKMSSLVADHSFDVAKQNELVDLIIEQLKQDKAY